MHRAGYLFPKRTHNTFASCDLLQQRIDNTLSVVVRPHARNSPDLWARGDVAQYTYNICAYEQTRNNVLAPSNARVQRSIDDDACRRQCQLMSDG